MHRWRRSPRVPPPLFLFRHCSLPLLETPLVHSSPWSRDQLQNKNKEQQSLGPVISEILISWQRFTTILIDSNCNYNTSSPISGHGTSTIVYILYILYSMQRLQRSSSISSFTGQSCKTVPSFFLYFHIVLMQPCQPGWKKRNWPDSDSFETWRLIRAIPHHQLPCPSLSSRHLSPYHF